MRIKFFGILTTMLALLCTGCAESESTPALPQVPSDGFVDVVLSVGLDTDPAPSRGVGSPQNISRGQDIDMLIYAVYLVESIDDDPDHDGYTLLTQYGRGVIGYKSDDGEYDTEPFDDNTPALETADHADESIHRPGQTVVNVGTLFRDGARFQITLRLMRGKQYCLVFWGQNSTCTAYNTEDFREVVVDYNGARCNDELRDAFCKSEKFTVSEYTHAREMALSRPFAQINMGMTEAVFNSDYKTATRSKMEFTGLADRINVITDEATVSDPTASATFDWEEIVGTKYATEQGGTMLDEYLYVKLDDNENFNGPSSEHPEVFKYMAMSYVLVGKEHAVSEEFFIPEVTVTIADDDLNEVETYELTEVPAHSNWRTNILDGIADGRSHSACRDVRLVLQQVNHVFSN